MFQCIHLSELPETFYLKLDEGFRGALFNQLAQIGGRKDISQRLGVHPSSIAEWKRGEKCIPLKIFKRIILIFKKSLNDIESYVEGIKASRYCKYAIALKFPIQVNEDWAYLSEIIRTDGHINCRKQIIIVNTDFGVIDQVKRSLLQIGIPIEQVKIYHRRGGTLNLVVPNITLGFFFHSFFEIQIGNKSGNTYLPSLIKESPISVVCASLKGIFDGDGDCYIRGKQIGLRSKSERYLHDVQQLLKRLGIDSHIHHDKGRRRLRISHENNLRKFYEQIGFAHTKRGQNLAKILSSYKLHMLPYRKAKRVVLQTVAELGSCTRFEIAKQIQRHPSGVKNYLKELSKMELVAVDKNRTPYSYSLTKKGYLLAGGEL